MSAGTGLALYTFGQFLRPSADAANQGFHDRNDVVLRAVDLAEGLIGRSGYDGDPGPESWGPQVFPRQWQDNGDGWAPSTLSLWRDVESAMAFSYSGLHAEALALGRQWFAKGDWPPLVLWWADARPDWAEAVRRYEAFAAHGPGPEGFGFKQLYDRHGVAMQVDRGRIKVIAAQNAARLAAGGI